MTVVLSEALSADDVTAPPSVMFMTVPSEDSEEFEAAVDSETADPVSAAFVSVVLPGASYPINTSSALSPELTRSRTEPTSIVTGDAPSEAPETGFAVPVIPV